MVDTHKNINRIFTIIITIDLVCTVPTGYTRSDNFNILY